MKVISSCSTAVLAALGKKRFGTVRKRIMDVLSWFGGCRVKFELIIYYNKLSDGVFLFGSFSNISLMINFTTKNKVNTRLRNESCIFHLHKFMYSAKKRRWEFKIPSSFLSQLSNRYELIVDQVTITNYHVSEFAVSHVISPYSRILPAFEFV